MANLLLAVVVDVLQVEGVDVAREVAKDRQADVDEKVRTASGNAVDADGRDCEMVRYPRESRCVGEWTY